MTSGDLGIAAPSFGRLDAHNIGDDQDAKFSMRLTLPTVPIVLPDFRYWSHFFPPLNQGPTSTCVAHALKHWMQAAPVIQTSPTKPPMPYDIYRQTVLLDEWPSNDSESNPGTSMNFGTSVRAAFKWAQSHNYVTAYHWAQNPADLIEFLSTQAPVVIGIGWFSGMMTPDANGFIHPNGAYQGGHSVLLRGRSNVRKDYTILNSWGPTWGRNGQARISDEDLHSLIFEQGGEAAAGIEQRLPIN